MQVMEMERLLIGLEIRVVGVARLGPGVVVPRPVDRTADVRREGRLVGFFGFLPRMQRVGWLREVARDGDVERGRVYGGFGGGWRFEDGQDGVAGCVVHFVQCVVLGRVS